MAILQLLDLPDELLGAIINQTICAKDTWHLGIVCKRLYCLAVASPVWRRHCRCTWTSWDKSHDLQNRLEQRPLETDWRALYVKRSQIDRRASQLFDSLLATQQARASRMHELAVLGPDVEDLLRSLIYKSHNADDVLARRWHAEAILEMIGRRQAVDVWSRQQRGEHVELEEALGAYDEFVLGRTIGVQGIKAMLHVLAAAIREGTSGFDNLTIRQKAVCIARHLRSEGVVGMPDLEEYHALRNSFISLALTPDEDVGEGCLPLQSVAIYCAVARRLGIDAKPSNFPRHVHAVITAPADMTLDGRPLTDAGDFSSDPEMMHMDPFRQDEEVDQEILLGQLSRIGVPPHQYAQFLGPTTELEMVLRTGRNILVSVDGLHMPGQEPPDAEDGVYYPDPDTAKYAALWSLFIHGDSDHANALILRRQAIRYLLDQLRSDLWQDVDLLAETAPRLLEGHPELPLVMSLTQNMLAEGRRAKTPVPRPAAEADPVQHRIGTYFEHRRYGYRGFVVGWSQTCAASQTWIAQMRVDELPRGRHQPFYNIV